jgi:hypothetical protein
MENTGSTAAYVKCYSATCKSSRTTTRAVDAESLDDASVFEVRFGSQFSREDAVLEDGFRQETVCFPTALHPVFFCLFTLL